MAALAFSGRVAVYFDSHSLDGLVWCVALKRGDKTICELSVSAVEIDGAKLVTKYERRETPPGERRHDGPPSAWQEGNASVEITDDGRAILRSFP